VFLVLSVDLEIVVVVCTEPVSSLSLPLHPFSSSQYVNYSNITLKAGGPNTSTGEALTLTTTLGGEDIEAKINLSVLRVPECGVCSSCTDPNSRKLCLRRLDARKRLIALEERRIKEAAARGQKIKSPKAKKRKLDDSSSTKKTPTIAKKKKKLMKKANGELGPRVTSQGNKRMEIPEELFPEFCRRIGARGTNERMKVINTFVEENPTISVRQVTLKFAEITTKERPDWVTGDEKLRFVFYLRPKFYPLVPESDLPEGWQKMTAEDEILWDKEQEEKKKAKEAEKAAKKKAAAQAKKQDGATSKTPEAATAEMTEEVVEAVPVAMDMSN
jgi:hypothetical protein